MKLKIVIHREEDGQFSIAVPALPACFSCGDTMEEAKANIREAAKGWLETNNDRNPLETAATGVELIEEVEF